MYSSSSSSVIIPGGTSLSFLLFAWPSAAEVLAKKKQEKQVLIICQYFFLKQCVKHAAGSTMYLVRRLGRLVRCGNICFLHHVLVASQGQASSTL